MKTKLFTKATFKGVVDKEKRIVHVIASTGVIDRHGESVNPEGWRLDNFMKNPVALIAHDYRSLPVGKFIKVWVEDGKLQGLVQLADTEAGREVFYLIEGGFLNTVSVGFIVLKYGVSGQDPFTIMQQELLEISFVAVPANPEALVANSKVKSKLEDLQKEIVEKGEEVKVDKKDVAETVALANVVDYLNFLINAFKENGVSEAVTGKMTQSLELLMEVLREEAVIGQKELVFKGDSIALLTLIEEKLKKALIQYKVVEEKIIEKIIKVKDDSMSDDAVNLMAKIRSEMRKSDRHSGISLKLINSLLKDNSSLKGGDNT